MKRCGKLSTQIGAYIKSGSVTGQYRYHGDGIDTRWALVSILIGVVTAGITVHLVSRSYDKEFEPVTYDYKR